MNSRLKRFTGFVKPFSFTAADWQTVLIITRDRRVSTETRRMGVRKMPPSLWAIVSLVLFAGLAVPPARANTIFVLSLGPNTTGSDEMTILSSPNITYNSTTMDFTTTGLELSFDGFNFPMNPTSTVVLNPSTDSYAWAVLTAGPEIIDESLGASIFLCNTSLIGSGCGASNVGGPPQGVAFLTPLSVAAPEPAAGGLMLIGVGLLWLLMVMRRRNVRGHQLAS